MRSRSSLTAANTPSSGRYDIWIGTFASGDSSAGTLYVTENSGNHPYRWSRWISRSACRA
jgi:hypothetical protein